MFRPYDHDLSLKLRFKRILYLMGYYSPIEVELSHYHEDEQSNAKRTSLTDLDVLGIKYDPVLTAHIVVADCKSGKNVSDPNRLFWLRGVSDYFGANIGYFLRTNIGAPARAIAPKLGLRVLDERELMELEQNLGADKLVLPMADPDVYQAREALWGIKVPKGAKPTQQDLARKGVFSHLSYTYWYTDAHRNLIQLISRFDKIAHLLNSSDPQDLLLVYAGLERFALCLLQMGSSIYSRGLAEVQKNARVYIYGGPSALREREQLMHYLRELTHAQEELDPPYLPDVIEVTNRMLHAPQAAAKVLPYLEAIYVWCVQLGNNNLEPAVPDRLDIGTIVLARDMCIAFCHATGIDEGMFASLLAL